MGRSDLGGNGDRLFRRLGPSQTQCEQSGRVKAPEAKKADTEADVKAQQAKQKKLETKIDAVVTDFFDRFDTNKDDIIARDELPLAMQSKRGYSRFNTDGEPGLSVAEVTEQARQRLEKRK